MKRLEFIKRSLTGLFTAPVLLKPVDKQIEFTDLLFNPYPNKNLYYMKPGKYRTYLESRLIPARYDRLHRYNTAHGYKIPPIFKNEEELYEHLRLMAHELNKSVDRGVENGHHVMFFQAFYKDPSFQLQWF